MSRLRFVPWVSLAALVVVVGAVAWSRRPDADPRASASLDADLAAGESYSNIHPADYVGPEACAACHPEKVAAWRGHPHARMNLDASEATVVGDFSGVTLEYAGAVARFERDGDAFVMALRRGEEARRWRVTRTVGSRFTQMYIGRQLEGPEPLDDPIWKREGKLPFGWWIGRDRWYPEVYFDSDMPPEYATDGSLALPPLEAHARAAWTENCIFCHNTYPYEERLLAGRGAPGFPDEDLVLGSARGEPGLVPEDLVTLGISCESCHFGGREHAVEGRPIRFLPQSPSLLFAKATPERLAGARSDPWVVNSICSQCHFARGVSTYPDGSGTWNSREAVDLASGGCAGALKCTDCHDPHVAGPADGGDAGDRPEHIAVCTASCHEELGEPDAAAEHGQHPVEAAVTCLDCHQPRVVQGLEHVVRTHRIGSPTDERMLAAAAPNACSLCHLDRSIRWTAAALAVGWGARLDPEEWAEAWGDLDGSVGEAWLRSREPVVRIVAADAWSRSPFAKPALPALLSGLDDPYAVNRTFAQFAVERVIGRRLAASEYDPVAPPEVRRERITALRRALARDR